MKRFYLLVMFMLMSIIVSCGSDTATDSTTNYASASATSISTASSTANIATPSVFPTSTSSATATSSTPSPSSTSSPVVTNPSPLAISGKLYRWSDWLTAKGYTSTDGLFVVARVTKMKITGTETIEVSNRCIVGSDGYFSITFQSDMRSDWLYSFSALALSGVTRNPSSGVYGFGGGFSGECVSFDILKSNGDCIENFSMGKDIYDEDTLFVMYSSADITLNGTHNVSISSGYPMKKVFNDVKYTAGWSIMGCFNSLENSTILLTYTSSMQTPDSSYKFIPRSFQPFAVPHPIPSVVK